jgi:hypothetical protein
MNVVPSVARPRVAGKNHADKAIDRDRVTDFELRFIPAASDSPIWYLFQLSHCDAPDAARTDAVETQVSSSLHEWARYAKSELGRSVYVIRGNVPDAGL